MIRLKKSTTFAIYAIYELAQDPERLQSASEIAGRYDISEHHLAKVLQRMARAGIVEGVRGKRGGFRLGRDAKELTMFDVVELFEPRAGIRPAAGAPPSAREADGARRVAEVLDEIDDQTYYTLRSISIATLVSPRRLS